MTCWTTRGIAVKPSQCVIIKGRSGNGSSGGAAKAGRKCAAGRTAGRVRGVVYERHSVGTACSISCAGGNAASHPGGTTRHSPRSITVNIPTGRTTVGASRIGINSASRSAAGKITGRSQRIRCSAGRTAGCIKTIFIRGIIRRTARTIRSPGRKGNRHGGGATICIRLVIIRSHIRTATGGGTGSRKRENRHSNRAA